VINKRDPDEWLAQMEQEPDSAPYIVRMLLARLQTLDQENQRLRNENIELNHKINTKAHQTMIDELRRQLKALARIAQAGKQVSPPNTTLIVWSKRGDILTVDLRKQDLKKPIEFPPTGRGDSEWNLTACAPEEELLVVTRSGNSTVFEAADLLQVSEASWQWHHIPDLKLTRDDFIAFIIPVAKLPLADGLITVTARGSARKLSRWSLDQIFQRGQFGKGVREENESWDWQAHGAMIISPKADVLLFSRQGNISRFPAEELQPSPTPAMRVQEGDEVVDVLTDDTEGRHVALFDAQGRALRRALSSIPVSSMGPRGKPLITTENLVSAALVDDMDRLAVLTGASTTLKLHSIDALDIPVADRAKPPAPLIDGSIIAARRIG